MFLLMLTQHFLLLADHIKSLRLVKHGVNYVYVTAVCANSDCSSKIFEASRSSMHHEIKSAIVLFFFIM